MPSTTSSQIVSCIRITNVVSGRSKDVVVDTTKDQSVFEAVYDNKSVKAAHIRKWNKELAKEIKSKQAEIQMILFDSAKKRAIHTFSVEDLKTTSTEQLVELNSGHMPIELQLTCKRVGDTDDESSSRNSEEEVRVTSGPLNSPARGPPQLTREMISSLAKLCPHIASQYPPDKMVPETEFFGFSRDDDDFDVEATSMEVARVRITNTVSGRSKDVIVDLTKDLSVFEAVYDHKSVKEAHIRKWNPKLVKEIKSQQSVIQIMLFRPSLRKAIHTFSVEDLKTTRMARLIELNRPNAEDEPIQLHLTCKTLGRSSEADSAVKEQNFTSELVRPPHELPSSISPEAMAALTRLCPHATAAMSNQATSTSATFSASAAAGNNTSQQTLAPSVSQHSLSESENTAPSKSSDKNGINDVEVRYITHTLDVARIRITNLVSGRSKDIIVDLTKDQSVFEAVYDNKAIIAAHVRKWNKELVKEIKSKQSAIEIVLVCQLSKEAIQTFSVDELKTTSTKQLVGLNGANTNDMPIHLHLNCKRLNEDKSSEADRAVQEENAVPASRAASSIDESLQSITATALVHLCPHAASAMSNQRPSTPVNSDSQQTLAPSATPLSQSESEATAPRKCYDTNETYGEESLQASSPLDVARIRITNLVSGRSKDLIVDLTKDQNVFEAVYDNKSVKEAHVRKWNKKMAKEIKSNQTEIQLVLFSTLFQKQIYAFSVEDSKTTSVGRLVELNDSNESDTPIQLHLTCIRKEIDAPPFTKEEKAVAGLPSSEPQQNKLDQPPPPIPLETTPVLDQLGPNNTPAKSNPRAYISSSSQYEPPEERKGEPQRLNESMEGSQVSLSLEVARIRITNIVYGRSKDVIVDLRKEENIFEAVYDNKSVKEAHVRKWNKELVKEIKSKESKVRIVLFSQLLQKTIQTFSVDELKTTSTKRLIELNGVYSNDMPIQLNLTCERNCTHEAAAEENTGPTISVLEESFLKPPPSISSPIAPNAPKEPSAPFSGSATTDENQTACNNETPEVKAISSELEGSGSSDVVLTRMTNLVSGRSKDVIVDLQKEQSIFEAVYDNQSVKAAHIRKWNSELTKEIKSKQAEIQCVLWSASLQKAKAVFSLDDLKTTSTAGLVELNGRDGRDIPIQLKLTCKRNGAGSSSEKESFAADTELREASALDAATSDPTPDGVVSGEPSPMISELSRIRITNTVSGRSKDVVVDLTKDENIFEAVYDNKSVKEAHIRKWNSELAKDIKAEQAEIQIILWSSSLQRAIHTFSVDDLKKTNTKRLIELIESQGNDIPIQLNLTCTRKENGAKPPGETLSGTMKTIEETDTSPLPKVSSIRNSASFDPQAAESTPKRPSWIPSREIASVFSKNFPARSPLEMALARSGQPAQTSLPQMDTKKLKPLLPSSSLSIDSINSDRAISKQPVLPSSSMSIDSNSDRATSKQPLLPSSLSIDSFNSDRAISKQPLLPSSSMSIDSINSDRATSKQSPQTSTPRIASLLSKSPLLQALSTPSRENASISTGSQRDESSSSKDNGFMIISTNNLDDTAKSIDMDSINSPNPPNENFDKCPNKAPTAMRIKVVNKSTGREKDLAVEISDDLNLFDSIYNNKTVKDANVRKWSSQIAKEVKNNESEVKCMVWDKSTETPFHVFSVDELKETSTHMLFDTAGEPNEVICLILECTKIQTTDLSKPTQTPSAGKQPSLRGIYSTNKSCSSTVSFADLTSPSSGRNREAAGSRMGDTSLHDLDASLTLGLDTQSLQTTMRVKIINETSKRSKDLMVNIDKDVNLFDAVYNLRAVKDANVRKWGATHVQDVKAGTAEILCLVWDHDLGKPFHTFSVDDLKTTSTKDLFSLAAEPRGVIELVLQCQKKSSADGGGYETTNVPSSEREEGSLSQQPSVPSNGGPPDPVTMQALKGPLSVSGNSSSRNTVKSDQSSRSRKSSIDSALLSVSGDSSNRNMAKSDHSLRTRRYSLGSVSGVVPPGTASVVSEISSHRNTIKSVLSVLDYRSINSNPVCKNTMRVRIVNKTTGRAKDLVVNVTENLSVYEAVYDHQAVKDANVRKWRSHVREDVKNKVAEIRCVVWDEGADEQKHVFSIEDLKQMNTKALSELPIQSSDPIQLFMECVKIDSKDNKTESASGGLRKKAEINKRLSRSSHMSLGSLHSSGTRSMASPYRNAKWKVPAPVSETNPVLRKMTLPSFQRATSSGSSITPVSETNPVPGKMPLPSIQRAISSSSSQSSNIVSTRDKLQRFLTPTVSMTELQNSRRLASRLTTTTQNAQWDKTSLSGSGSGSESPSNGKGVDHVKEFMRACRAKKGSMLLSPQSSGSSSKLIPPVAEHTSAKKINRFLNISMTPGDLERQRSLGSLGGRKSFNSFSSKNSEGNIIGKLNSTWAGIAASSNEKGKGKKLDSSPPLSKSFNSLLIKNSEGTGTQLTKNVDITTKSFGSISTRNSEGLSQKSTPNEVSKATISAGNDKLKRFLNLSSDTFQPPNVASSGSMPTKSTKSIAPSSDNDKINRFLSLSSNTFQPPKPKEAETVVGSEAPPMSEIVVTNNPAESGISLSADVVKEVFPYHIILDAEFRILQVGASLSEILDDMVLVGRTASDVFMVTGPIPMFGQWDWSVLNRMKEKTLFFESVLTDDSSLKAKLKGTLVNVSTQPKRVMLALFPNVKNLTELSDMDLSIADLPLHSCQREAVLLGEHSASEVKLTNHLDKLHRDLIDSMEQQIKNRTNELANANQDLEKANTQLASQSSRQLEHFACMSHEIRTPLNCIVGMSSVLLEDTESEMDQMHAESIRMIYTSGELLRAIVDDVLDYAKLESGSFEVDVRKTNLQESLDGVVHSISQKVQEKNIRLRTHFSPNLPKNIETDSRRLQQVLFNLLGNSGKFSVETSVIDLSVSFIVALEESKEHLSGLSSRSGNSAWIASERQGIIRFSVRDYGKGIEKKDFKTIFEPFNQASKQTASVYGGTGLGLSITSKLVKRLGGTISVDSELGKFTDFTVDLPFNGEPVDKEGIRRRLEKAVIVMVNPNQKFDYSFTSFPIKEEPMPLGPEVIANYGVQVVRSESLGDVYDKISRGEIQTTGQQFAFLVHEDLFDRQTFYGLAELVGLQNCTLITHGQKYSIKETKERHIRSLAGMFPSVLLEYVANRITQTEHTILSNALSLTVPRSHSKSTIKDLFYALEESRSPSYTMTSLLSNSKFASIDERQESGPAAGTEIPSSLSAPSLKQANPTTSLSKEESYISSQSPKSGGGHPEKTLTTQTRFDSLKVLYAEDNKVNQKVLSKVLNRVGIKDVTIVDNGQLAVDICEKTKFDVIFMDMQMPVMDGVEACKRIVEKDKDAKVIFVTAHALDEFKSHAEAAGGSGFISKPFRVQDVQSILENLEPTDPEATITSQKKEANVESLFFYPMETTKTMSHTETSPASKQTPVKRDNNPSPSTTSIKVTPEKTAPKENNFGAFKVLYAEDNKVNQKVLSKVLNRVGITDIAIVENGQLAVDICKETQFDVIFMDMQMPVMDGIESCELIMERDKDAKVIFVTAHALDEFKSKADAAGGFGFISKPFRVSDIQHIIKDLKPLNSQKEEASVMIAHAKDNAPNKAISAETPSKQIPLGEAKTPSFTRPSAKTPDEKTPSNNASSNDYGSLQVLYAEDNKINQKVLSRLLNRVGIKDITIVDDGQQAVDICKERTFDVIFMDYQMPIMDGIEATSLITKRDKDAKIFFVSAHALDEFRTKAAEAGGLGFISKPCRVQDIQEVLKDPRLNLKK